MHLPFVKHVDPVLFLSFLGLSCHTCYLLTLCTGLNVTTNERLLRLDNNSIGVDLLQGLRHHLFLASRWRELILKTGIFLHLKLEHLLRSIIFLGTCLELDPLLLDLAH